MDIRELHIIFMAQEMKEKIFAVLYVSIDDGPYTLL